MKAWSQVLRDFRGSNWAMVLCSKGEKSMHGIAAACAASSAFTPG